MNKEGKEERDRKWAEAGQFAKSDEFRRAERAFERRMEEGQ